MFNSKIYETARKHFSKRKAQCLKATKKYQASKKGKKVLAAYAQTEAFQIKEQKWRQSEKCKQKNKERCTKRRRKLNWILMFPNPFDDSVPVDYHHITDAYVVAVPRDLHKLYYGKYHREKLMPIIKQIYLGD